MSFLLKVLCVSCGLLFFSTAFALGEAEGVYTQKSRFLRTAGYLISADAELRADFSMAALDVLAQAYILEADLALKQAQEGKKTDQGELVAWAAAVRQFARQLSILQEDINLGFPVSLGEFSAGSLAVTVAGRTVILNHPRGKEQSVLEHNILQAFCAQRDCEVITPGEIQEQSIPVSVGLVRPKWAFSENGPQCEEGNIRVSYQRGVNLSLARTNCQQLIQEIRSLITELAWQKRHSVSVHWADLSILANTAGQQDTVVLNTAGDTLLLSLPLLRENPPLLAFCIPWLRRVYEGGGSEGLKIDAMTFGLPN